MERRARCARAQPSGRSEVRGEEVEKPRIQEFRSQPNHVANKSARFVVGLSTVSVMFSRRRRRLPFELLASRLLEFLASRLLRLSPLTFSLPSASDGLIPLKTALPQRICAERDDQDPAELNQESFPESCTVHFIHKD